MTNILNEIRIRKLLWGYILTIILSTIIVMLPIFGNENIFGLNFSGVVFYTLLILWLLFIAWRKKGTLIDIKRKFKIVKSNLKEILSLTFINLAFSLGLVFLISAIIYLISPNVAQNLQSAERLPQNIFDFLFLVLGSIILAPLVEEITFRGIILNRLSLKWGIPAAIIVSSIVFGVIHLELAIIGAFAFGVSMSVFYKKTKTLLVPITAHFINNLVVTFPLIFMTTISQDNLEIKNAMVDVYIPGLIGLIITIFAGYYLSRYWRQNWPKNEKREILQ